jgi:hypothetical protein
MTDGKEFASANRNSPARVPLIPKLTARAALICNRSGHSQISSFSSDVTAGRLQLKEPKLSESLQFWVREWLGE